MGIGFHQPPNNPDIFQEKPEMAKYNFGDGCVCGDEKSMSPDHHHILKQ